MSEHWTWQPGEGGQWGRDGCELGVEAGGTQLHMYHDTGLDLVTILPDDLRLCRRVPAPQGVSVPMAVRAAINWLDSNSQPLAVKETEWTERWGIVLDWLDACPERDGGS